MEYYVNSLNNISGLPENEEFLSFTPIGNAQNVHIANLYDRPIPSTLQTTSPPYTFPYNTSPNLQMSNNINTLDTDMDLTLKTGLGLRQKNNQANLSSISWPSFGDISAAAHAVTSQNAGQNIKNLPKDAMVKYPDIPGLNHMPSAISQGVGILNDPSRNFVDSYVVIKNYQIGPFKSSKEYKNNLFKKN
jgi:hypothetical protein